MSVSHSTQWEQALGVYLPQSVFDMMSPGNKLRYLPQSKR